MADIPIPKSRRFLHKKWVLFASTLVALVSTLIIVIITTIAINSLRYNYRYELKSASSTYQLSSEHSLAITANVTEHVPRAFELAQSFDYSYDRESFYRAKKVARAIVITVGVIAMLIQFIGIVGALKEHYYLTYTYGVLCAVIAGLSIYLSVTGSPGLWFTVILYFLIACLSVSFAKDIRQRAHLQHQIQTPYVVTNQQNPIYGVQGEVYPAQLNVPVQQYNPGQSTSMANQNYSQHPGQSYPMTHNQIYSNAPVNQYQPFQSQYLDKQRKANPSYTQPDNQHSSAPSPPPYVIEQNNSASRAGWNTQ